MKKGVVELSERFALLEILWTHPGPVRVSDKPFGTLTFGPTFKLFFAQSKFSKI